MDGITSFSYKPLKLASLAGAALSVIGFFYLFIVLYLKIFTNATITGWSSLIVIQLLFNGIILFILGIVGEYIGRIYDESKQRPLYIVQEVYQKKSEKKMMYRWSRNGCHWSNLPLWVLLIYSERT